MKITLYLLLILIFSGNLYGQVSKTKIKSALPRHEISGIIQDSTGLPISGTTVFLSSKSDSVKAITNEDGIFIFKNISSASFELKLNHLGFKSVIKRYYFNDVTTNIVLDPIILQSGSTQLKEVLVNGAPTIIYKTDTVEYKAADYKTNKSALLYELLNQMPGVDVGSDGTMLYLGQQVTKARLNGKNFAGGDVAQTIQNLPADIADKVQFIDDYGTQANRTGIKSGDPTKVLNVTTKADKSVGNLAQILAGGGTKGVYNERLFAQHLNGNQQLGLIANVTNTINGVSGYGNDNNNSIKSGATNGNLSTNNGKGGTTTLGNVAFNYRDQLSNRLQINLNYFYNKNINNSSIESDTKQFNTISPLEIVSQSTEKIVSDSHNLSVEFEYTPNSRNFILFTPVFNFNKIDNLATTQIDQFGLINQLVISRPSNVNKLSLGGGTLYYQHTFKTPGRNLSFQLSYLQTVQNIENAQADEVSYLNELRQLTKDSIISRSIIKQSENKNFTSNLTYIEPIGKFGNFQFSVQTSYKGYSNSFETYNDLANSRKLIIDSLTNNFPYKFFQSQISSAYLLKSKKTSLSLGVNVMPALLIPPRIEGVFAKNRYNIYLVPVFRFQYSWSQQQNLSVYYEPSIREPSYIQLQPLPDYTNPVNTLFGNPSLKLSLTHRITASYVNYLPNDRINIAININGTFIKNQVTSNSVQLFLPTQNSIVNQTYFQNINGNYTVNSNISISKQLPDRIYNFEYNATANYGHLMALNNFELSAIKNWHIIQRLGPKIIPNQNLQLYSFIAYDITELSKSIMISGNDVLKTTSLNFQGNINFLNTYFSNLDVYKNYTSGLNTQNHNPFIANISVEKTILSSQNARIKFQVFDLFNQNNYINRIITTNSLTDINSSALKRYFMLSLVMNFQKWNSIASRNGKQLKRRGDGSFIYP